MTPLFIYFIKVNLALALLYITYRLLFRNDTFFGLRRITLLGMLLIAFLQGANAREESETDYKEQQVDVNEIVFGHIGDSYEWHITDIEIHL